MAAKKKTAKPISSFDDLDAAGIGVGYQPFAADAVAPMEAPAEPERTWGAVAKDVGVSALKGAIAVPEAAVGMADLLSGGRAGKVLEDVGFRPGEAKAILDEQYSDKQKQAFQSVSQAEGFTGKMGAALANPSVIGHTLVESAPLMGMGGVIGRGVMAAAPRVSGVIAGAIGEGAVGAGSSAEAIRQASQDGTLTGKQAALAGASGALTGAFTLLDGKVAQKLGIADVDTMLAGAATNPAVRKGVVRSALEGAAAEGILEELPQSVQEQVLQNAALGKPLDEGVDQAAVMGLLSGMAMGGGANAVSSFAKPPAQAAADTIRATETVPESGPMTRASNAATEAKAQAIEAGAPLVDEQATAEPTPEPVDDPVRDQILALPDGARQNALRAYAVVNRTDVAKGVQQYNRKLLDRLLTENAPPPVLGERLTETDMGSMLGGGGMTGNADPLAGALGMGREAQANSITNVANVAERRPPMPASDAARMLDEARNRGLDLAVAEHPAGGFVLVPPNWVTPDMAAQGETRLAETIARMQQADSAPVERAPRTRTEPVDLSLSTDPVQNYMATLRSVNTPAARAYVRDFDAGRITPSNVQQRMVAEKGKTPDQRIAQAAAEAPAQTDPVADRLARAAAQGIATPAPTDILNPSGEPFKTRMAADRAAKKTPGAVVPVEGGFVVRPQEPVNVQDVPQAPEVPQAAPVVSQPAQAPQAVGAQPAGPAAGGPAEGAGAVEAAGVGGAPTIVEVQDNYGRTHRVRQSDLYSNADRIPTVRQSGDVVAGEEIPRSIVKDAPSVAPPAQEATYNGTRIYPTKTKVGDEVKSMWAVESPDNQRRRAAGERTIGGDSLHDTIEQAKAAAEREAKRDAEQRAAKAEQDAADKARLDAEEARKAVNRPKTVVERRKDAILDGPSKIGPGTKRAVITSAVDNGYAIEAKMVYDSAAKKRDQEAVDRASRAGYILGVSNENLPLVKAGNEAKARLKEGKYEKPEYRVYQGSDTKAPFREITKTEYDYAQELKAQRAAAPQAAESPTLQTAMGDAGWAGETGQGDTIWTKRANGERYTALLSPDAGSMEVTVLVGAVDTQIASFKVGDAKAAAEAANKAVAQDVAEQSPADDALPNGWTKSVNGYTKRPVYRMEQGGGQPFAVVTQVEGMQYEVQIRHGDKQLIVSNQTGALSEVLAKAEAELTRMTQADSVTHQDPGEKAEAATPGVVTDSLKKAARNEDTKPSEMRKWLVGKIDEAIAVAPKAAVDFLSFDVPGDGTFKVQNSQARLQEFRKKVMTSPGFKDGGQKQNTKPLEQVDSAINGSGSTVEAIRNFLADGDVQGAIEFAKLKGVEFTPAPPQMKMSADGKGKVKHMPASVKSSVPSVADGLTQVEAEQINQYLTAERQVAEAVAQPITSADVTAAQQQAAAIITERIDAMTAGEVNTIARRFLPTMGVRPTVSKERNKAAVTDFTKVNPLAAADEFGATLPADVRRALQADMEGTAADGLAAAKQEPGKPIEDAGEKIGGARKDRWKERGLNLDDLDAMTEAEGAELATKANVWKPDYEAMSEASEPVTAAMVKTIYDQLAAKPKKNTPEGRRQYVQMMRIVRDVLTEADGPEAVKNAYQEIRKRAGLNTLDPKVKADGRELLFSVYKGRSDPFVFGFNELQRAKKLVEDGFPAKAAPWKSRLSVGRREGGNGTTERGIEMYMELSAEVGTPLTREQIEAGFFRVVDKKNKAVAFAATKEDAEAAAATVYERDMKGKKDGKPEPVRPNLDELKRENLPKRIERDVKADDFVNDLGFRGIEFGNWSAQDERQRILNMAYDGLMDLAEIMGVPPKAMSLNGTLGMAFGARGGGRFAAHYEPGKLVINMTKIRGGGSMAHEWAHAMDHYFGELDKPDAYTTQARGASGWYSEDQYLGVPRKRMERVGNEWKNVEKMRLDNLRPEMGAAFDEVMRALFQKQVTKAEMVRSQELDLERTESLVQQEQDAEMKAMYQRMATNKQQALNELRGDPDGTMYAGRGRSDYASQAQALSGKSVDGYWVRPTEMFARAFESWVFDRVTAMGAKSDYLVHGVEEDRFAGGAYKGNPYPAGEERARINAAFDKLASTIQTKETDKGVAMFSRAQAKRLDRQSGDVLFTRSTDPSDPYRHKLQAIQAARKQTANVVQADNGQWLLAPKAEPYTAQEARDAQQRIDKLNRALKKHNNVTPAAVLSDAPTPAMAWGRSIARTLGYNVTFIQPNPDFHGVAVGGDAFVSASADHPEIGLIGHEVLHSFKQSSPDIYQALAERIRPYLKDGVVDAKRRWEDANGGRDTSMAHAEEEVLADLNGAMWLDPKFWREMAKNDQSLFRQVAYKFMEVATKAMQGLSRFKADSLVTDVDAVREIIAQEWAYQAQEMGNPSEFAASDSPAFSRTTDAAKVVGDTLKSITVANVKKRAGFKLTDYLGIGLQALGRRQIVDIYGDLLPLTEYNRLVQQMEADKNEGGAEADQLVTRWAKLDDESKLADLMHDATLAQIDPDKPFSDGDDKGKFLMLERKFKLLSDEAKAVYRDTRDAYKAHHAKVRSAIKERIERSEIKGERKAALLKQMDDEFFAAVKGVYFPLARFGQYVVTVKGPDGKVESVSRAETMAEADALRGNLLSAFPRDKGFTVGRVMLSKEFVASRDAVGRGFMTELYQVLDKQDMDAVQRAELEDTLGQLYLSSLPDLSWAKHGIHRKGTPGFSQDARRAYAQNMFHGARYLAKLRYSDLMQDELGAMQKHVDDWREVEDFDQNSAQRVVDEMNKRHESLMNPKSNALSTALTSLGFVFHLGLSPASAMVNLSQTALVAYPIMGAKWGFGKASAALLKASAEAAKGKNDITASLNEDERAAYDEAVRAGTIDVTMAHDLAGIAQGEDAGVMWKIRPVMRYASFLFHHAERFNRQVTFVAAYRLARDTGADHKAAFEQATKATYDGHFDYGAANRPRFMQGNVAKVLLLFKQYGQNMVYTLARNAQQAMKAETPEARTQARKALGGLLATHAAAAGVLGLPMVTTLLAAASMIGGDDDEPWDAKVALQNMLADAFGQKPAEVLAHGLSRLTPWDISGRVGLDRLIFPDVQEGLEGQRLWESAATQALGPVGGIAGGALKGLDLMSDGHYKLGLEAMLPAVLRQAVKSVRYATDGAQDKSGVSIKDEVSTPAVVGQLLGFSPSDVRLAQEGKSAVYQQDRALGERRQELLTKAARATMAKDAEARAEAMKEIERFNQKNPTRRITPLNVLQSVRNRNKRIDQSEGGIYLPKNRRDAMDAGRFAVSE